MRNLLVLFFVVVLTVPALAQKKELKWLGAFTTETYPIKGCQIVKVDDIFYSYSYETFLVKSSDAIGGAKKLVPFDDVNLGASLSKTLLDKGFNALIGTRGVVANYFNPVMDLAIINGSIGLLSVSRTVYGNPALIVCK